MNFSNSLLVGISAIAVRGLVGAILWEWFFVPLGLPSINALHFIGLYLTYNVISFSSKTFQKSEEHSEILIGFSLILSFLFCLVVAQVAAFFM